jgi:energy-coupling factor transport system permease protein
MQYRRRHSPLHAAGAGAGLAWCLALACAALMLSNPIALGALCASILAAGAFAGVWRELRRAALFALPLALTIAVINALLTRDGLTVILRLGDLPVLGVTDVTLEATLYGAILGLRAATLILCGALYSLAVDPDEVLGLFRRWSFRSALSASIATRMVPVLLRDSRRLADAQRCRAGANPGRVALMRASTAGLLDRALDVAAALEVRGYGTALTPRPRGSLRHPSSFRRPGTLARRRSRHDLEFGASAVVILVLAVAARVIGLVPFRAYPTLYLPADAGVLVVTALLAAVTLAPFADRKGIE